MNTGEKLRNRRKKLKISAEKVAEYVGISRSTYFKYEKGDIKNIPLDKLKLLSEILGLSLDYLTKETREDEPDTLYTTLEVKKSLSDGDVIDIISIPANWTSHNRKYIALSLADDRFEPECPKGGTLIIGFQSDFEDGQYIACTHGENELVLGKGYHLPNGDIIVIPPNNKWEATIDSLENMPVVGVIRESRRKYL